MPWSGQVFLRVTKLSTGCRSRALLTTNGATMIFKRQPKDPNERVSAAVTVLRQQHQENNERGVGLIKRAWLLQDECQVG